MEACGEAVGRHMIRALQSTESHSSDGLAPCLLSLKLLPRTHGLLVEKRYCINNNSKAGSVWAC